MNKIVALDVDGVLNRFQYGCSESLPWIDRDCLGRLDRILSATGAKVVVSSTWRKYVHQGAFTMDGFRILFKSHGMLYAHHVVGVTDDGPLRDRGAQVRSWLNLNAPSSRFVAVDDMELGHAAHGIPLVQTDGRVGLTDADADRAIAILGGAS